MERETFDSVDEMVLRDDSTENLLSSTLCGAVCYDLQHQIPKCNHSNGCLASCTLLRYCVPGAFLNVYYSFGREWVV